MAVQKKFALGRGLDALISNEEVKTSGSSNIGEIELSKISANPNQPRREFDPIALQELADSIAEVGVIQPITLRKINDDSYQIIAGERRWRASKIAGLDKVPVIIKELNDKEVLEVALVENLLRENLSAIEEAEGFQRLINEFSHTQEALSQIVGKSRSHIANMLRLLNLPEEVQALVKEGKLSAGHARALVGLDNALSLAKTIIEKDLNVRQVEELVARQKEPKKEKAPNGQRPSGAV